MCRGRCRAASPSTTNQQPVCWLYDPLLGRFLSADPLVQAPFNGQNLNRYSYVFNNPLSLIDPSGFAADDDKIDTTGDLVSRDARSGPTRCLGCNVRTVWSAGATRTQLLVTRAVARHTVNGVTTMTQLPNQYQMVQVRVHGSTFSLTWLGSGSAAGYAAGRMSELTARASHDAQRSVPQQMADRRIGIGGTGFEEASGLGPDALMAPDPGWLDETYPSYAIDPGTKLAVNAVAGIGTAGVLALPGSAAPMAGAAWQATVIPAKSVAVRYMVSYGLELNASGIEYMSTIQHMTVHQGQVLAATYVRSLPPSYFEQFVRWAPPIITGVSTTMGE